MYKVRVTSPARKEIKRLPEKISKAIFEVLLDFKHYPYLGKPLREELTGRQSYRVGNYRIIYKVVERDKVVKVLKVQHRSVVYN